jgi:hypothetical protein
MPKTKNVKKAAAATAKSIRAVMKASGDVFMSVQSAKGNGNFVLKTAKGKEVRCGRISRGLRISVGQIVVTEGDHALGVEVIGVIGERAEAERMVRKGIMPAEVLLAAVAVGSFEAASSAELDDLFERRPASEGVALGGGGEGVARSMKDQRAMASSDAAIAARVAALLGGGGSAEKPAVRIEGDEEVEEAVDLEDL